MHIAQHFAISAEILPGSLEGKQEPTISLAHSQQLPRPTMDLSVQYLFFAQW